MFMFLCRVQLLEIYVNWILILSAALFICCCIYRTYKSLEASQRSGL